MKKASRKIKVSRFRVEDFLKSEEAIREIVIAAMEESTPEHFLSALGKAVKARGITVVAERSGLSRQRLLNAFAAEAKPRYETVCKLVDALGLKLSVKAA
jgi:probable addiction module antidote protein